MLELRNFKQNVKNKATGTPYRVYYIQPSLASSNMLVGREEELYTHLRGAFSVVHSKMIFLICYLLDYQQVHDNTNVSIILLGDKKEPTK